MKQSAGILLYRKSWKDLEVLLVHPSGNYNRKAPWGIPKGEPDPDEPLEDAARREVREETGVDVTGPLMSLDSITYVKSKKTVHGYAGPFPAGATPSCASWEIDGVEFMTIESARSRMHPDQQPFLDRLIDALSKSNG